MKLQEIQSQTIRDTDPNMFVANDQSGASEGEDSDDEQGPITFHFYEDPELNQVVGDFMKTFTKHRMKRSQGKGMWQVVSRLARRLGIATKSYDTTERKVNACLPTPKVSWKVKRLTDDVVKEGHGEKFPEKRFKDKSKFETLSIWTRIPLKELIDFHFAMHKKSSCMVNGQVDYKKVRLSFTYDGIPYAKSSSDTLNVMGVQFDGCRQVYIPHIRVAKKHEAKDIHKFLDPFIKECLALGVKVKFFLADAPMRAFIKCIKGHAGKHSCEICEAMGEVIMRKVCYPPSQMHQRRRSHERWLEFVHDLETQQEEGNATATNVKGITGRSPLLTLPEFDIIRNCPPDPFHRDWLGIVRSGLWRHTVGLNKGGVMNRRGQRICDKISEVYRKINLPSEFSHRSRPIDYANFKGHEWKSMTISCIFEICDIVEDEHEHQTAHVWLLFVYLVMIYNGPTWAREALGNDHLKFLHELLYDEFAEEFGPAACTFNWHGFSHMPEIAEYGRPEELSTEPYESAYGRVKHAFHPGTRNVGLQIARNMLLRCIDHVEGVHCAKTLRIKERKNEVRNDDSIVIDDKYNYYSVIATSGDLVFAREMKKKSWKSRHDPTLDMDLVGIYKYKKLTEQVTTLKRKDIRGKGVMTQKKILIPFYWDMLFS